jgi:prepilin-type N-terminal cleavage/methylation domain-containing protein
MELTAQAPRWNPRFARALARRSLGEGGFTLVEMLLVLALMALVAAVLLPAAGALFRAGRQVNPSDLVAEVLQEVRREAVLTGRVVTLRFDREAQRFAWDGTTGGSRAVDGPRLNIDFLRPVTTGAVLLGGQLVETGATRTLAFYPDGTCDRVRVQIRPAEGAAEVISIDVWTCAPGLEVAS